MRTNYWEKFEEHCFYHIYNRGINSETIFLSEENHQFFLLKWAKFINPYFDLAAYCLMPNHFHFLVRLKPVTDGINAIIRREGTVKSFKFLEGEISFNDFLEDQFKRLFTSYALAFNKQQERTGSLFQKRFKRVLVKDDFKLWYLLAYIHHNPIQHKFCEKYEDWKYSSFQAFLSHSPTSVIRQEVLSWFDSNDIEKAKKLFLEYHREFLTDRSLADLCLD